MGGLEGRVNGCWLVMVCVEGAVRMKYRSNILSLVVPRLNSHLVMIIVEHICRTPV